MDSVPPILALPDVAMEKIFSNLSYDEIAKNRVVCKKFNRIGSNLLTRGFLRVEKRHNAIYKKMKSQLPRRESERRSHPMARNCDILSAIETRLSMLNMTYTKYIDISACCFIPGKVIDEVDRILSMVEFVAIPPCSRELLQELRDISSMAMEHFDEAILPKLKPKAELPVASSSKGQRLMVVQEMTDELCKVMTQCKKMKQQLVSFVQLFNRMLKGINKKLKEKSQQIISQKQIIEEQAAKFREQENTIADLKKHVEEWDQKFADLTSELMRVREDFVQKSPSNFLHTTPSSSLTPPYTPILPRFTRSHLKSRTALPKYSETLTERKRKTDPLEACDVACKIAKKSFSEDISDHISKNITSNISKNITNSMNRTETKQPDKERRGFSSFFASSIEAFLKSPINSITSRKRKMTEDISL